VGDGDDHVLAGDKVLVLHIGVAVDDQAAARDGEGFLHLHQLLADDLHDPLAGGEDVEDGLDLGGQLLRLVHDLLAAETGEARQGQRQDGPGLLVGEPDLIAMLHPRARVGDQGDQRGHVAGRPGLGHQALARLGRILGRADDVDHFVDIDDGDGKADQDVAAIAGPVELELVAADHHLLAEADEAVEQFGEAHLLGPAQVQRQHVDAERALQGGEAVELVQHHVGLGVALQLDDDTHALAVALVAQVGDALDPLLAHQLADVADQGGLFT